MNWSTGVAFILKPLDQDLKVHAKLASSVSSGKQKSPLPHLVMSPSPFKILLEQDNCLPLHTGYIA